MFKQRRPAAGRFDLEAEMGVRLRRKAGWLGSRPIFLPHEISDSLLPSQVGRWLRWLMRRRMRA